MNDLETRPRSALAVVRDQVPDHSLTPSEARQVIERQATRLLKLADVHGPSVPVEDVARTLPRVQVRRVPGLPSSGRAQWNGHAWVLLVDSSEPGVRQRFSLAHELAHVIYHPLAATVLPGTKHATAEERLEHACEYFAACLLMPRTWMKRAYFHNGIQDVPSLARLFGVSWVSMRIRLEQLGFVDRATRTPEEAA